MKHVLRFALILCATACAPPSPPTGLAALHREATWNLAREAHFRTAQSPGRSYRCDGEKGEMVCVQIYSCPQPELVLVTCGETYHNTTGWDVHLALMRTNDVPIYPGNLYVSPLDSDFALDWLNDSTLGIYYLAGSYPDIRDVKTGAVSKRADFQYERQVVGVSVKFIPADPATLKAKRVAMSAREIRSAAALINKDFPAVGLKSQTASFALAPVSSYQDKATLF